MTKIYRYQPVIIDGPNGTDYRPSIQSQENQLTELAEVDGFRYVSIPDDVTPVVPDELTTWEEVIITPELSEKIKSVSPHCQLIRDRFIETIRTKFSLDDELYFARISVGSVMGTYTLQPGEAELLSAYQTEVESARATMHDQYKAFGLLSTTTP